MIRKSLKTTDLKQATKLAKDLDELLRRLGTVGAQAGSGASPFTVEQAIDLGISHSKGSDHFVKALERHKKYFLAWLTKKHPAVKMWSQLLPLHVDQYCKYLADNGAASGTQIAYLDILRLASTVLSYNFPSMHRPLNFSRAIRPTPRRPKQYLSLDNMLKVLDATEAADSRVAVAVILGTWAGCRLSEVVNITTADIRGDCVAIFDRKKRLGGKTHSSPRLVPLCDVALKALKRHLPACNVITIGDAAAPRLISWTANTLSEQVRIFTKGLGLDVVSKDACRKSYANLLKAAGIREEVRKALMGWTFKDIAGNHYEDWAVHPDESPDVAQPKLQILRSEGIQRVNEYISKNSQKKITSPLQNGNSHAG